LYIKIMKKYTLTTIVLSSSLFFYSEVVSAQTPPPFDVAKISVPQGASSAPMAMPPNIKMITASGSAPMPVRASVPSTISATGSVRTTIKEVSPISAPTKNATTIPSGVPSASPVVIPALAPLKKPDNLPVQSGTSTMKVYQNNTDESTTTPKATSEKKGFFARIVSFFKNLFTWKK
jgi:hypothetical protein